MTEENCEIEKGLGVGEGDEVVYVGDAGHWLHHIKDENFNEILVKWLEKTERK